MSITLDAMVADDPVDALPLQLLGDECAIDAAVGDVAGAGAMLVRLIGIVLGGFGAHAVVLAATAWPSVGPATAATLGAAWFVASAGGFFAAICAGLPSYWFYGVVARIEAPAWRLAVELVRVEACLEVRCMDAIDIPLWLLLQQLPDLDDGGHVLQISLRVEEGAVELSLNGEVLDPDRADWEGSTWTWTVEPDLRDPYVRLGSTNVGGVTAQYEVLLDSVRR